MAGSRTRLLAFGVAAVLLTLLDLVWGYVAADLYRRELGVLLADPPRPSAAVAFYLLFVAGLVHFVVLPAGARRGRGAPAVGSGAFFGLVAYATWDLTNLAVLDGFPASLVPVDLAWGAALAASVSGLTTLVARRLERPPSGGCSACAQEAARGRVVRPPGSVTSTPSGMSTTRSTSPS